MNLHPIALPKKIKVSPPKLASVHVQKVGNGFKVQHNMTHGPHPKPFVFSDPSKMTNHLKRIQASQWREPDRDEASKITHTLDLG